MLLPYSTQCIRVILWSVRQWSWSLRTFGAVFRFSENRKTKIPRCKELHSSWSFFLIDSNTHALSGQLLFSHNFFSAAFIPFCVESINIFIVKMGNAWLIDKYLFLHQLKLPERVHVHYSPLPIQLLCNCQPTGDRVSLKGLFKKIKKIYDGDFSTDVSQRDNYVIAYLFCYIYEPYNNGTFEPICVGTVFTVHCMLSSFFFSLEENCIKS